MTRAVARLFAVTATVMLAYYLSSLLSPVDAIEPPPVITEVVTPVTREVPALEFPQAIRLDRVSYYHAVPEQTDDDPFVSACGPNRSNQIAVSRDLFRGALPCGARVTLILDDVGTVGEFIVWDTMASRWNATADVLVPNEERPGWGLTTGWLIIEGEE